MHHAAVVRFRRQRRVHVLHRYRRSRHARSRRRSHRRQVRRRRRRHHPILRLHLPRPQLIHHHVIHPRRSRSRIGHQPHAERPFGHWNVLRPRCDLRAARRLKRRPRDNHRPLRRRPVRQIHVVRHRRRRRPALAPASRNPEPDSRDPHHHPITKPPHRAASGVTHILPPNPVISPCAPSQTRAHHHKRGHTITDPAAPSRTRAPITNAGAPLLAAVARSGVFHS